MEDGEETERQISVNQIFQRTNYNESVGKKILTTGSNERYDYKRLQKCQYFVISNRIQYNHKIVVNNTGNRVIQKAKLERAIIGK